MNKRKLIITGKKAVLILIIAIELIPFILLLLTSIKPTNLSVVSPPVWKFKPTFDNYLHLLLDSRFLKALVNSVVIAGLSTLLSTIIGVFAGYAFARFRFKGNRMISYSVLYLRLVPPIVFVIPYFLLWRKIGLQDSYISMILMYAVLATPLIVWMMRSFFQDVPVELEEAAMVDGCSRWKSFLLIIIPAIRPGIFASATLGFISVWNEFIFALYNTGRVTRTLPVEIYNSLGYYQLDWARLSSSSVIAIIPAVLFISLTQKYIVRGLTMGAIKG